MNSLKENEIVDDLQRNGLKIIQNQQWFKFGIDAVLLAYFTQLKSPQKIIDLGTGSAILPILLSDRYPQTEIIGVEYQVDVAEMAARSIALNGLSEQISILTGDIKQWQSIFKPACCDVVITNPPYFKAHAGLKNRDSHKMIARHEVAVTLNQVFEAAASLLIEGGQFFMVHRANRLVDILARARFYRLEPKLIQFIKPKAAQAPNLLLLKCIKQGGAELKYLRDIVVYRRDGQYSEQLKQIYNQARLSAFNERS